MGAGADRSGRQQRGDLLVCHVEGEGKRKRKEGTGDSQVSGPGSRRRGQLIHKDA